MNELKISGFKAVLFDLDSTLTDTNGYAIRASAWILEQCTSEPDKILQSYLITLVKNYRHEIHRVGEEFPYISPYECVRNAIKSTISEMNLDANSSLPEEGAGFFKRLHLELSKPVSGVEVLLKKFKLQEMKVGVLTNSFEGHARIILERHNLSGYFDAILDGSDVQSYKPRREAFEYILDMLDVKKNETLFIGDEFYADIVGAVSLGMRAIWINARNQNLQVQLAKYGQSMIPVLVIGSLSELEKYL